MVGVTRVYAERTTAAALRTRSTHRPADVPTSIFNYGQVCWSCVHVCVGFMYWMYTCVCMCVHVGVNEFCSMYFRRLRKCDGNSVMCVSSIFWISFFYNRGLLWYYLSYFGYTGLIWKLHIESNDYKAVISAILFLKINIKFAQK